MRFTVLALALLPLAAQAQDTTAPAQIQSCPAGMAWDTGLNACTQVAGQSKPMDEHGFGAGCNYGAAREVTS